MGVPLGPVYKKSKQIFHDPKRRLVWFIKRFGELLKGSKTETQGK